MNLYTLERKKYFELIKINFNENIKMKIIEIYKAEGIPTKSERYAALEEQLHIKKDKIEAYLKWCQSSISFIENQRKFNEINRKIQKELEQQSNILKNFIIKEAKINRILDSFAPTISSTKKTKISKSTKETLKTQSTEENKKPKKIIVVRKKKTQ